MTVSSARSLLHPLGQGVAVAALLAALALTAFAVGLALLGAMIAVPIAAGVVVVRQHLRRRLAGDQPIPAQLQAQSVHL